MPLANVALTDTFDIWRIRTNQLIYLAEGANDSVSFANTVAQKAFDKANSANLLALSTGIISNAFTSATIAGANTAVGTGANAFSSATIAGANTYLISIIAGANTAVGAGANAFAAATIAGANTAVGGGANAFATAAAAGANNFMIAVQNGSNTAVGAGANAFAATVGTGANNFLLAVIAGANTAVGAGANAFATSVGASANVNASNASFLSIGTAVVSVGGTGRNSFTNNGILFGNTTSGLRVTDAGTEGHVLQVSNQGTPFFGHLDGGTFS